jgi:uncharacterized protein (TIRG00374 family)
MGTPMTVIKPPMRKWILLAIIAGLVLLILYIYYIVGFGKVILQLEKTNLYLYAAAFVAMLAATLFFSLAWRSLLANLSIKIKVREAFLFLYAGLFIDFLVPDPADIEGNLMMGYLASRASGESSGKTTASVIAQKIIGIVITVGNLVAGLILLAFRARYSLLNGILIFILFVIALLIASIMALYYISTRPKVTRRISHWIIRLFSFIMRGKLDSEKLQATAHKLLESYHEGFQTLAAKPKALIKPMLLSILSWAFDVSVIFLVFASIGHAIPVDQVLIVYALTGALQAMGISFIGVTEVITSTLYTILGIQLAVSLWATLLTRFITFWFKLLISYCAFQYAGLKLLFNQDKKIEQKTVDSVAT